MNDHQFLPIILLLILGSCSTPESKISSILSSPMIREAKYPKAIKSQLRGFKEMSGGATLWTVQEYKKNLKQAQKKMQTFCLSGENEKSEMTSDWNVRESDLLLLFKETYKQMQLNKNISKIRFYYKEDIFSYPRFLIIGKTNKTYCQVLLANNNDNSGIGWKSYTKAPLTSLKEVPTYKSLLKKINIDEFEEIIYPGFYYYKTKK